MNIEKASYEHLTKTQWWIRRVAIGIYIWILACYCGATILGVSGAFFTETFKVFNIFSTINTMMIVWVFAFTGGVLRIMRNFVFTSKAADNSGLWYLFTPYYSSFLGILLYLAARAGQLILYSGGKEVDPNAINVYALALIASLSGLFSDEAYQKLKMIANSLFLDR